MATSVAFRGSSEPPTDGQGPTGRLCDWLARLRLSDVPRDVRERAKALILDGIACALVGAQLPWSRTAVERILRIEGSGNKTIIGWGETASGPVAALLNGTFIQGFELDDFHPGGPLHSAAVVIPRFWPVRRSWVTSMAAIFCSAPSPASKLDLGSAWP